MRYVLALLMVVLVAAPVAAKKKKHAHAHASAPKVRVVKNDLHARESAMAEAQLAELRGSTELAAPAADPVSTKTWAIQEWDKEVPEGLKKK
jgi:hypothetical protein